MVVLLLNDATGSSNFKSKGSVCRGAGFESGVVPAYSRSCTCTNCTDGFATFFRSPTGSGTHFLSFLPALDRGTVLKNAIPCPSACLTSRNVSNQTLVFATIIWTATSKHTDVTPSIFTEKRTNKIYFGCLTVKPCINGEAICPVTKRGKSNLSRSSRRPQYQ